MTWVPDQCTLPTAEQPLRVAEFDDLLGRHLVEVQRVAAGDLLLTLQGPPGLRARAQDLADRETSCCSFFAFTVTERSSGEVRMRVQVGPAHVDVLEALADRAETARAGVVPVAGGPSTAR